ncbi:endonuclease-reverse transcriptase [Elysia marginata]|uniref:Endonuclease-reverse transcriptase n=1 Tax=Elysia marginata TaxID=1093978 RepID=A0AAV4GB44_9GAST|nr:endonuclease-reverse transcriptase [Elysia marginata]
MYGCEAWTQKKEDDWTQKKEDDKRIEAAEMFHMRILRVKWTNKRTNVSVLKKIGTNLSLQQVVNTRKLKYKYAGHALRNPRTTLMKAVYEGKLEGKETKDNHQPPWCLTWSLSLG